MNTPQHPKPSDTAASPTMGIDPELLPYLHSFHLPASRVTIRRSPHRDAEPHREWIIDTGMVNGYVYRDGSWGTAPRHRVYEELDMPRGEDELQGKPDSEWARVARHETALNALLRMTLEEAWQLTKSQRLDLNPAPGETYLLNGESVEVLLVGDGFVRVRDAEVQDSEDPVQNVRPWQLTPRST